MLKKQSGFTIVELLITMVIFVFVIAAAANMFSSLLTQFKQQSKIAETNIEGIVGLELLRFDIEQAGYGLPWTVDADGDWVADADWSQIQSYCEAISDPPVDPLDPPDPAGFNDGVSNNPCPGGATGGNAPRAIVTGNGAGLNGSDYLVIKATNIATNSAAQKYSYIVNTGLTSSFMTPWGSKEEDLNDDSGSDPDRVIAVMPEQGNNLRVLLTSGGSFFGNFSTNFANFSASYPGFLPIPNSYKTHIIYGVDTDTDLTVPFNRSDYYVRPRRCSDDSGFCSADGDCPAPAVCEPTRCAPGTGVLVKSVLAHANRSMSTPLPLLDCVRDMQLVVVTDTNNNDVLEYRASASDFAGLSAEDIRTTHEVRVYILAHEGQQDSTYTADPITVNDPDIDASINPIIDLDPVPANLREYRWKVYTMVITPYSIR